MGKGAGHQSFSLKATVAFLQSAFHVTKTLLHRNTTEMKFYVNSIERRQGSGILSVLRKCAFF